MVAELTLTIQLDERGLFGGSVEITDFDAKLLFEPFGEIEGDGGNW